LSAPAKDAFEALVATTWLVAPSSNRVGVRLEGLPIEVDGESAGRLVSRGTAPGAVQIVPGGQPIILFVDAPTTGGYPIGGVVATADLPLVGQLGPGDQIQFVAASLDQARTALTNQQRTLNRAALLLPSG
jgi:antagonist of KipI